jgi:hypothetical protein
VALLPIPPGGGGGGGGPPIPFLMVNADGTEGRPSPICTGGRGSALPRARNPLPGGGGGAGGVFPPRREEREVAYDFEGSGGGTGATVPCKDGETAVDRPGNGGGTGGCTLATADLPGTGGRLGGAGGNGAAPNLGGIGGGGGGARDTEEAISFRETIGRGGGGGGGALHLTGRDCGCKTMVSISSRSGGNGGINFTLDLEGRQVVGKEHA